MILRGRVWKFGNDVDTDVIIPVRYCGGNDPAELGRHCMEGADARFSEKVKAGDIIVAGSNFGCGSSREPAPVAIKAAGVSCVIAKSFARIFFRNAINIGLPLLESEDAVDNIANGDTVEVDLATGRIKNLNSGKVFTAKPYPDFMAGIIAAGGLIEYTKKRIAAKAQA